MPETVLLTEDSTSVVSGETRSSATSVGSAVLSLSAPPRMGRTSRTPPSGKVNRKKYSYKKSLLISDPRHVANIKLLSDE